MLGEEEERQRDEGGDDQHHRERRSGAHDKRALGHVDGGAADDRLGGDDVVDADHVARGRTDRLQREERGLGHPDAPGCDLHAHARSHASHPHHAWYHAPQLVGSQVRMRLKVGGEGGAVGGMQTLDLEPDGACVKGSVGRGCSDGGGGGRGVLIGARVAWV